MLPGSVRNPSGYSHVPSNDGVRIDHERQLGQMASSLSNSAGNLDMDVDPTFITPSGNEVQNKRIATLLNDVNKIHSRRRVKPAPTLATGRRNLKNEKVSDEEAKKRCKRRDSNRLSAQRSREKRNNIAQALEEQLLQLQKANDLLQQNVNNRSLLINRLEEALKHSCPYGVQLNTDATHTQVQPVPVTIMSQPMSASSCGSDYPVSTTSQGLTPPPINEEIVIKHSPPDSFEQPGTTAMRPNSLSIPAANNVSVPSNQSYLAQLQHVSDQQSQVSTAYFQTTFCDNLSTPVLNYAYSSLEYNNGDISVLPQMNDTDGMTLP